MIGNFLGFTLLKQLDAHLHHSLIAIIFEKVVLLSKSDELLCCRFNVSWCTRLVTKASR